MRCEHCREALSARLDEDIGVDHAALDAHLAGCADCRAAAADLEGLHRAVRVRPAQPVPDLTEAILARKRQVDGGLELAPVDLWVRGALVAVGLAVAALSITPLLATPADTGHLAAWDLAFAAGLLFAAWQPERSRGLFPMAVVLVATMSVVSIIHLRQGHPASHSVAQQIFELGAVVLLAVLMRTTPASPAPASHRRASAA